MLFGVAAFSGTQNVVSKQARLDRTFGEARVSLGSWNNQRATLDYNRRLDPRAAIRVNLMLQDRDGWRALEQEWKRAAHVAGKLKLGPRTELRGELDAGRWPANPVLSQARKENALRRAAKELGYALQPIQAGAVS